MIFFLFLTILRADSPRPLHRRSLHDTAAVLIGSDGVSSSDRISANAMMPSIRFPSLQLVAEVRVLWLEFHSSGSAYVTWPRERRGLGVWLNLQKPWSRRIMATLLNEDSSRPRLVCLNVRDQNLKLLPAKQGFWKNRDVGRTSAMN